MTPHRTVFTIADPTAPRQRPSDASAAIEIMNSGNAAYAGRGTEGTYEVTVDPEAFGVPRTPGTTIRQEPLAATLSCSDARVPMEQLFGRFTNDLFVTRVAGNVPSPDVIGSLQFAESYLPSVKAIVVVGHSSCGAVTAAVDSVLKPTTHVASLDNPELGNIVATIIPSVRMSVSAITEVHGSHASEPASYRTSLIDVGILANAAVTAMALAEQIDREVFFGVYDLSTRLVGIPGPDGTRGGLHPAPGTEADLRALLSTAARALSL